MFRWLKHLAAVGALTLVAACGGGGDNAASPGTIVQQAQADGRLSTLVEALNAADLAPVLSSGSSSNSFTVFAPTNDAFAKLLTELGVTKEQLLADKTLLSSVLTYHVLPTRVTQAEIPPGKAITTVQGGIFKIDATGSALVITDGRNRKSQITATDVPASNGVIHVIDTVLLPANKNIVQTAQAAPEFSVLVEAVVAADLVDALSAQGPLTVFAPTNAAFANLLAELGVTKEQLLANRALLTQVLTYHVVTGRLLKADVPVGQPVTTLQGQTFTVDSSLAITDQRSRRASIVATDVLASNGVIHVVDKVILPRP
jgi:uncharacterized surface protein with fasciclin (FAS1) repeats